MGQVCILTIGDEEPLVNYAKQIVEELRASMVRCEADFGTDPIKGKIANAEEANVHTILVIGGRDMEFTHRRPQNHPRRRFMPREINHQSTLLSPSEICRLRGPSSPADWNQPQSHAESPGNLVTELFPRRIFEFIGSIVRHKTSSAADFSSASLASD